MAALTKTCSRCTLTKPLDAFNKRGAGRNDRQAWCRGCKREHQRIRVRRRRGLPDDTPSLAGQHIDPAPPGTTRVHNTRGYVHIKAPDHHRADRFGWTYEHIIKAEEKFGFPITRDFTVHHINGDRSDNRPENLDLRYGNHGKGADVLPALLRVPAMRELARTILASYRD